MAARAIGGLCSAALRFGDCGDNAGYISLEEFILMHALGMDTERLEREQTASGVMMIPIPRAGILEGVTRLEEARRVPNVEDIIITAHISQELIPPPEGGSYLGFIFARAKTAEEAETAIREAHRRLGFAIGGVPTVGTSHPVP
ncbi:MAG: hypothetical protein ACREDR_09660 [Blastocatellia bacterium]